MTRAMHVEARCTRSREALHALPAALRRTWELRYDEDHRREPATPRTPTLTWRPHWLAPTSIQRAYLTAVEHLGRAHWRLATDTDVEGLVCWDRVVGQPPHRMRTVPLGEATAAVLALDGAIGELCAAWRDSQLAGRETRALARACDEAQAALAALPDGLRKPPQDTRRRCRRRGCIGPDGKPRAVPRNRRVCDACRQADARAKRKATA